MVFKPCMLYGGIFQLCRSSSRTTYLEVQSHFVILLILEILFAFFKVVSLIFIFNHYLYTVKNSSGTKNSNKMSKILKPKILIRILALCIAIIDCISSSTLLSTTLTLTPTKSNCFSLCLLLFTCLFLSRWHTRFVYRFDFGFWQNSTRHDTLNKDDHLF